MSIIVVERRHKIIQKRSSLSTIFIIVVVAQKKKKKKKKRKETLNDHRHERERERDKKEMKKKSQTKNALSLKVFFKKSSLKSLFCFPKQSRSRRAFRDTQKKKKTENSTTIIIIIASSSSWRRPFRRNLPAQGMVAGGSPEGKLGSATPTTNSNTTFAFQT